MQQIKADTWHCLGTYTGDGLGHAAEEGDMQGVDFRLTHLLVVAVEPQVVRTVAP